MSRTGRPLNQRGVIMDTIILSSSESKAFFKFIQMQRKLKTKAECQVILWPVPNQKLAKQTYSAAVQANYKLAEFNA